MGALCGKHQPRTQTDHEHWNAPNAPNAPNAWNEWNAQSARKVSSSARCTFVVGPGGSGKTSTAVQIAQSRLTGTSRVVVFCSGCDEFAAWAELGDVAPIDRGFGSDELRRATSGLTPNDVLVLDNVMYTPRSAYEALADAMQQSLSGRFSMILTASFPMTLPMTPDSVLHTGAYV